MSSAAALSAAESSHVLRFYTAEDELVDAVIHHLSGEWNAIGVVVATPAHRQLIGDRLACLPELDGRAADAVVMLDADVTLRTFFDGTHVDRVRFDEVIGQLIRTHARPDRPVRVYGEMVALLWDAGQVNAALELEQLWNDLAATVGLSLLCGYPTHSTLAGNDAIRRVCAAHSGVLGRPGTHGHAEASAAFERSATTPSEARQFVTATLERWGALDQVDDIVLVADELVTNAVLHGRSDVSITLTSNGAAIRVAVADRSPAAPRPANRGASAMSGRGLHIVDVLSSAWGYQPSEGGKIVWARFDGLSDIATRERAVALDR